MATTNRKNSAKKAFTDYYVYVPLGAAQFVVEKAKNISATTFGTVRKSATDATEFVRDGRHNFVGVYQDLAKRGKTLASSVGRMAATKRAAEQMKLARSSIRRAAKATTEATKATATATRTAAKKVG